MLQKNYSEFISTTTELLTKEFNQVLLSATDNRSCYSLLVLDMKIGNNKNQLFYIPASQTKPSHKSAENIFAFTNVLTKLVEIPQSLRYSPMFLPSAIADKLEISLLECFSTPACRIEYSNDRNDPPLYAVMFGKKQEWPYHSPIINLFVSFIDYVNKQKNSLSLTDNLNIDKTITETCDYASILRAACERELIYRFTGKAVAKAPKNISYFDLTCNLACMTYEGASNTGYLRFTAETVSKQTTICFQNSIPCTIENRRELRKLLEMTDSNTGILVTKGNAVGLTKGKQYRSYIQFKGSGKWKLYIKDETRPILSVEGNICRFCPNEASDAFHAIYRSVFNNEGNPDSINAIIDVAMQQKHGTSIIVSEYAEEEARRLASFSRAIQIIPINFNKDSPDIGLVKSLTAIDGALLISLTGECFAIGAILDGESCSPGSTARGARYNSLANYVEWKARCTQEHPHGIRSIAVVISEDQTVDFITPSRNC